MMELEKSYQQLHAAIDDSMDKEKRNLWLIHYCWWQFYYCLNREFEGADSDEAKEAVIEAFIKYDKELQVAGLQVAKHYGVKADEVEPLVPEDPSLPPHIKDVMAIFRMERDKFASLTRAHRRGKNGLKSGRKRVKDRRVQRSKWLES